MLPLYLHVYQKPDDDDDVVKVKSKEYTGRYKIVSTLKPFSEKWSKFVLIKVFFSEFISVVIS